MVTLSGGDLVFLALMALLIGDLLWLGGWSRGFDEGWRICRQWCERRERTLSEEEEQ